jgi:sensor histidine kinase regulating citrate/malate metabolism
MMNIHSIKFRLFVLGVLTVVLPMAIVGTVSIVDSSRSLTQLSKENALATASYLATQVESTMDMQAKLAQSYAMDTMVRSVGLAIKTQG